MSSTSTSTSTSTVNQLPKLHMINANGINVKIPEDRTGCARELYYNGKPLKCQTGLINCPYGMTEDRKLRVSFNPQATEVLSHLDKIIKDIAVDMDVEHQPLSIADNEVTLTVNSWTNFFDNNKVKMHGVTDVPISSEFTAFLLLDVSKVYIFEDKIKLYIGLLQVMIRNVSTLPTGCHIFSSLTDLRSHLSSSTSTSSTDAVNSCDLIEDTDGNVNDGSGVNELLE